MKLFQGKNIDCIVIAACKELVDYGVERSARGLRTIEVDGDVCLVLEDPTKSVVTLSERRRNHKSYQYLEREFNWYLSGILNVDDIAKGSHLWKKIQNYDDTVNSNYGFLALVENWNGASQFEWCINKLTEDKDTRQAIINYSQPRDKYDQNKDFVCTIGQQFILRKGKLESITWMRSNDIIRGLVNDIPWFTYLQRRIAGKIGCDMGKYTHFVTSLHAYETDFEMVKAIANSTEQEEVANTVWNVWNKFTEGDISSFYQELINMDVIHDTV